MTNDEGHDVIVLAGRRERRQESADAVAQSCSLSVSTEIAARRANSWSADGPSARPRLARTKLCALLWLRPADGLRSPFQRHRSGFGVPSSLQKEGEALWGIRPLPRALCPLRGARESTALSFVGSSILQIPQLRAAFGIRLAAKTRISRPGRRGGGCIRDRRRKPFGRAPRRPCYPPNRRSSRVRP